LTTEDHLVAARGGVCSAATAAVGASAQANAAGRRDSGVGTGASAEKGGAGRPADWSGTAAAARGRRWALCERG